MRTLLLTLAPMVAVAVTLGTVGTAIVQAGSDQDGAPVGVVIDVAYLSTPDYGQIATEPGAAHYTLYGRTELESWQATDPRLSGDATYRGMRHEYPTLSYYLAGYEYALANEGGSWSGTGTSIHQHGELLHDKEFGDVMVMTLQGAGGYEGLTAYLTLACAVDCRDATHFTYRGLIVADQMPPFPDPVR